MTVLRFGELPESSVALELLLIGAALWCWPMANSLTAWDSSASAGAPRQRTALPGDRGLNLFGVVPIGSRPGVSGPIVERPFTATSFVELPPGRRYLARLFGRRFGRRFGVRPFGSGPLGTNPIGTHPIGTGALGTGRATAVRVRRRKVVPTLLSGAIVLLIGTVPHAVAAVLAVGTATVLIDGGRRRAETGRLRVETANAVKVLGRELRAGSSVPTACEAAAGAAGPHALSLMTALGVAARVGAGAPGIDPPEKSTDGARRALGAAMNLSRRYGIPLAALVDGAAEDLARSAEAAVRQDALLAGPRLSGYLLSALPLLGILLGVGMGVNPLPVLFGPGVGAVLLILGVLLTCLGLLWSARIAQ